MKIMRWGLALFAAGALSVGSTLADGGPLIDALVKKGVLSSQEGEEVRMEMQEAYMSTGGGMLNWGNSSVRGVKIYGDVRLRYQWSEFDTYSGPDAERGQFRYRLRAGADYQFTDNFKAGVRFSTQASENSTNNTMDSFLQGTDPLFVDLYYLIYSADDLFNSGLIDHVEIGLGKFKQPFMIGKDLWDGDINPEGAYGELGWDNVGPASLVLRGGAFLLDGDFQVVDGTGTDEAHDFLFAVQAETEFEVGSVDFTVAPSFWISTGGLAEDGVGLNRQVSNGLQNEYEDFGVFVLPAQAKFKAFGYGHTLHAKYGINAFADDDTNGGAGFFGTNNQLFTGGYKLGSAKKKGSWQIGVDYRYIEGSAWSSRLVDSDFGFSGVNNHGVVVGANLGNRHQ